MQSGNKGLVYRVQICVGKGWGEPISIIKQTSQVTTAPTLLFSVTGVSLDLFLLVTGGFSQLATKIELGLGSRWPFYSDSI